MFGRRNKEEGTELPTGREKKPNAWKKYGAIVMTGALVFGTAVGNGAFGAGLAQAEEEEQRITLNVADGSDEASEEEEESEKEPETAEETETETETEAKEVFDSIASVETGEEKIMAMDVSEVVENCMPSIVSINEKSVEEVETYFYGKQTYESVGAASGIIVAQNDEELLVATNSHVVDGATELSVCFTVDTENPEDLVVPAKIKGKDSNYELAVIAVQLSDIPEEVRGQLRIAKLGKSSELKVGQAAIAIGNALGYGQSVTSGIISALNRNMVLDNYNHDVIVTDAAINLGNSGGALLNANGEVIGINVAKESGSSTDSIGYAIPIDLAVPVLERLVNKETRDMLSDLERGYLGVTVVNVSDDAKELYDMPEGAFVYEVEEGSAGEKAGIRKGDVITKFDDEAVASNNDLVQKMKYFKAGETVKLEVQTANNGVYEAREVEVTLQEVSEDTRASLEQQQSQSEQSEQEALPDQEQYEQFDDGFGDYNNQWNESFGYWPFQ